MRSTLLPLAVGLVAGWVRLYTTGAPPVVREERRTEIASDLWKHQAEACRAGMSPGATAGEIVGRCWRGMPADLAWRLPVGGESAMLSKVVIERGTGLLLLLVVGLVLLAMGGGRFGIGAEEPYFTYDFPGFANNLAPFGFGLAVMAVAAVAIIAAAAALWITFQRHEPVLAAIGSFGLCAAGVLLLVTTGAGRAVYSLAAEWRQRGGTPGDAVWSAARAVALVFEYLAFVSFGLLLLSLLALGLLILRRRVLPRWLGGLATVSGLCVVLGFALGWAIGENSYFFLMSGMLIGLIWFVVTGIWLVWRGTVERESVGSGLNV